jgi:hypothetical protein
MKLDFSVLHDVLYLTVKRLSPVKNTTIMTAKILNFFNSSLSCKHNFTGHCAACYGGLCIRDQSTKKSPRLPPPKLTLAPK